MSLTSVAIDADEWNTVACLASRLEPDETGRYPGVALRQVHGQRQWSIQTPWIHVDIPGGDGAVALAGTTWLPTRLVVHAAELATTPGYCNLIVGIQSATVVNDLGSAHFTLAEMVLPPRHNPPRVTTTPAIADCSVGDLLHVLRNARRVPHGVDLSVTTAPDVWLGIEPGFIAATVAWSHFGAPQATLRTPANTTGNATIRIPHYDVALLLDSFQADARVRLSVDDEIHVLWIDGHNWSAAVALTQMPGTPRIEPSTLTLDDALDGVATRTRHGGPLTLEVAGSTVTVEDPDQSCTVRATVVLATDVTPTRAILTEINALNAGLSSIRVWLAEGTITAGFDHPRQHLGELATAIGSLVARTADIGPMVAMLGAFDGHDTTTEEP